MRALGRQGAGQESYFAQLGDKLEHDGHESELAPAIILCV